MTSTDPANIADGPRLLLEALKDATAHFEPGVLILTPAEAKALGYIVVPDKPVVPPLPSLDEAIKTLGRIDRTIKRPAKAAKPARGPSWLCHLRN